MKNIIETSNNGYFMLEKEKLSDNSEVFNVIIRDSDHKPMFICYESTSQDEARALYNTLSKRCWDKV